MDKINLLDLIRDTWNKAAPNIRGMRPVTGETFIAEILWPKLQPYTLGDVHEAMRVEIANGAPPQIRAVAERCADRNGAQGHSPPVSHGGDKPVAPPSPFDESRRGDEDYCNARLLGATLAVGFQTDKREAIRTGAEFAGISEAEFRSHLGDLSAKAPAERERQRRHALESIGDILGQR